MSGRSRTVFLLLACCTQEESVGQTQCAVRLRRRRSLFGVHGHVQIQPQLLVDSHQVKPKKRTLSAAGLKAIREAAGRDVAEEQPGVADQWRR